MAAIIPNPFLIPSKEWVLASLLVSMALGRKEYHRIYRCNHREKVNAQIKKWQREHVEERRAKARDKYLKNRTEVISNQKAYHYRTYLYRRIKILKRTKELREVHPEKSRDIQRRANNKFSVLHPDRIRISSRKSYLKNIVSRRVKGRRYSALWRLNNPDKLATRKTISAAKARLPENVLKRRVYFRMWRSERVKKDINYRVLLNLRSRLSHIIKRKNRLSTVDLIGCSVGDLIKYLETQFKSGMSWINYGKGHGMWQIDHKYPVSKIDVTNPHQVAACFSFKNLQPIWHRDNMQKGNKILPEYANILE